VTSTSSALSPSPSPAFARLGALARLLVARPDAVARLAVALADAAAVLLVELEAAAARSAAAESRPARALPPMSSPDEMYLLEVAADLAPDDLPESAVILLDARHRILGAAAAR
jgi:hypothetical protein